MVALSPNDTIRFMRFDTSAVINEPIYSLQRNLLLIIDRLSFNYLPIVRYTMTLIRLLRISTEVETISLYTYSVIHIHLPLQTRLSFTIN